MKRHFYSPILILHGWNLSSEKYEPLKKNLEKQGYKVYVPNLPGFGATTLPKVYDIPDYALYVREYMKKNKLDKPVVIGHSFGGRIAIYLEATHHNIFSKLILTGVPGYPPASSLKVSVFKIIAKTGRLIFSLPILNLFSKPFKKLLYFFAGSFDYYKTDGIKKETFKNVVAFDISSKLSHIKNKTLIIWGKEDRITPIWIAKKMNENIQDSKLIIIDNEKHNFLFNNPELFVSKCKNL